METEKKKCSFSSFVKYLITNSFGLFVLLMLYVVGGAYLFIYLELPYETEQKNVRFKGVVHLFANWPSITHNFGILGIKNITKPVLQIKDAFKGQNHQYFDRKFGFPCKGMSLYQLKLFDLTEMHSLK